MSKEKEIGEIFRESLDGIQTPPPEGLWETISQDKALARFNRRHRLARIAKFAAVPFIASIVIVTAILLSNGSDDKHLAVAPSTSTNNTTITTTDLPAPAPEPTLTDSNPIPVQPAPNTTPATPTTDFSKEQTETIATPEATIQPVESAKVIPTKEFAPTREEKKIIVPDHTDVTVPVQPSISTPSQPEPKAGKSGQLTFSKDTSVCRNSQLTLHVYNAIEVRWNIGVQGETVTIYPEEPLLISADVTTYDKTDTTIYIRVDVFDCGLWIPTAFTPNGDGLNDEFIVQAPTDITHYECAIYDRSRGLLFRTNNILQGWDGTFNGKTLPFGTYFYIITYLDGAGDKHVEKGQITLIR